MYLLLCLLHAVAFILYRNIFKVCAEYCEQFFKLLLFDAGIKIFELIEAIPYTVHLLDTLFCQDIAGCQKSEYFISVNSRRDNKFIGIGIFFYSQYDIKYTCIKCNRSSITRHKLVTLSQ